MVQAEIFSFNFLLGAMPSFREERRKRVVHFFTRIQRTRTDWKPFTVAHFVEEGMARSSIYHIINEYLARRTVKRRRGSGRPCVKMDSANRQRLRRMINHRTGISQRALGAEFSCSHQYISHVIKKLKISYRKRMKVPKYKNDAAVREARRRCRILYRKFRNLEFVIDDEKYFGFSGFQMSGNKGYYTSDSSRTPTKVKTVGKKKFEPKVMLWIAMSPKGISRAVLTSGRSMSVTSHSYVNNCLNPHLLRFLNTHYPNGGYIFWPDKASAHYARLTTNFLDDNNVNYVKKEDNPTEVPQCRPIEDFFGLLAERVYRGNWEATDAEALKRRIRRCLSEIPPATVQATMASVRRRLMRAYRVGLLNVCH